MSRSSILAGLGNHLGPLNPSARRRLRAVLLDPTPDDDAPNIRPNGRWIEFTIGARGRGRAQDGGSNMVGQVEEQRAYHNRD